MNFTFMRFQTLYIGSAILTALSFILFAVYCSFWLKQPGYEWLPHFCFACIIFFNYTGLVMIPYTISIEIFPKEVYIILIYFDWIYTYFLLNFLDSRWMHFNIHVIAMGYNVHNIVYFSFLFEFRWIICLHDHFGSYLFTECWFWNLFCTRNTWKILWGDHATFKSITFL